MEYLKTPNTDKIFQALDVSWRSNDRPVQQTSFMEFSSHLVAWSLRNMAKFAGLETLPWEQGLNRANYLFAHKKNPYLTDAICIDTNTDRSQLAYFDANVLLKLTHWIALAEGLLKIRIYLVSKSILRVLIRLVLNGNMVELNCDTSYTLNQK